MKTRTKFILSLLIITAVACTASVIYHSNDAPEDPPEPAKVICIPMGESGVYYVHWVVSSDAACTIKSENGDVFIWNGEAYREMRIEAETIYNIWSPTRLVRT